MKICRFILRIFIQSKEILIQTKDVFLGKEKYKHDWVTFVESSKEEKNDLKKKQKTSILLVHLICVFLMQE